MRVEEIGIVVKSTKETATIVFETSNRCDHCDSRLLCYSGLGGEKQIEVLNEIKAKIGDKVKVEISSGIPLFVSFILFIIPIIVFIISLVSIQLTTGSEKLAVLGGFTALLLFFLLLARIKKKVMKNIKFKPRIKEILKYTK